METATNSKQHVHFLYEQTDSIARITFNRPDRLNSLTFEVYAELRDTFAALNRDDSVRAVIITGQGRAFCSGGDVEEILGQLLALSKKSCPRSSTGNNAAFSSHQNSL